MNRRYDAAEAHWRSHVLYNQIATLQFVSRLQVASPDVHHLDHHHHDPRKNARPGLYHHIVYYNFA